MKLALRCDAGPEIGSGHLMRCLALAQAWIKRGGSATFITNPICDSLEMAIADSGATRICISTCAGTSKDAALTLRAIAESGSSAVAIDGYSFDTPYQSALRASALPILIIDDYVQSTTFAVDVVLNQNVFATADMYPRLDATLLCGSRYTMLRHEFRLIDPRTDRRFDAPSKILITMGGADPDNATLNALTFTLKALWSPLQSVTVLLGPNYRYADSLLEARAPLGNRIQFVKNCSDMAGTIREADFAVCAGGATCWEAAFLGTPFACVILAENQLRTAKALQELGVGQNLGWLNALDESTAAASIAATLTSPSRLASMSNDGRRLVDGKGADRVTDHMWKLATSR